MFRYRILIAIFGALLVYAIGYAIDLRSMSEYHSELSANEIELRQMQFNVTSESPRHAVAMNPKNDLLQPFLHLIELAHVTLDTFKKMDVQTYQVSMVASYADALHFFQLLNAGSLQYALQKLMIKLTESGNLKLDFVLKIDSGLHPDKSPLMLTKIENPFCENTALAVDRQENLTQLDAYALSEITMLGTIKTANKLTALILFPNGVTKEVSVHMKLGKEQGVIKAISSTTITLDLPSHQSYQLHSG